ncbi:unnamed protein product [Ceutorhynchus assimilis]|uniref:Gustatory receptor n=1 Tax=Ceutorhynchus assimilis TaxID=467358 RepID=A0A9N9MR16_9CUCU|nr:unnamed protein product [Ceutorhynchus assimilis]
MFIDIARKWPNLMRKWDDLDLLMKNYPIAENYLFKMKMVAVVLFILSLSEHIFFTATLEVFRHGLPFTEELSLYFNTIFKFVFMVLPYNIYLGLFLQILNWLWTIVWNYVDVFLISLFISFAFRQKQIEKRVATLIHNRIQGEIHWKETREHFVKLTDLCNELENCISPLVLVSFANKLFVVLYQLMCILSGELASNENNSTNIILNRLYYTFSFVYILLRLAGVIFFASVIDVKNQEIVCNLFSVSSEMYNTEIERFITSIQVSPPIISGAKLFEIKKSLLLKIASSIIVYELVIMKFKSY